LCVKAVGQLDNGIKAYFRIGPTRLNPARCKVCSGSGDCYGLLVKQSIGYILSFDAKKLRYAGAFWH